MFTNFYNHYFKLQNIENITDLAIQRTGKDKKLILLNGEKISIEEKKRRRDYGDMAIEVYHIDHGSTEKRGGWIYKITSDYLAYGIETTQKIYLLSVPELKKLYRTNIQTWRKQFPIKPSPNKNYNTYNLMLPWTEVESAIIYIWKAA